MKVKHLFYVIILLSLITISANAQIKLACVGNSITAGTSGPSYVPLLQQILGTGYSLQNDGLGGTTLLRHGDAPYWNTSQFQDVFTFKPALITIKLGTNDSKSQNWNAHKAEFAGDLNALIDTFLTISPAPQIWLVLCAPCWPNGYGIIGDTIDKCIVPIIRSVAQQRSLPYIDCSTPLLGHPELIGDGVHPNAAGADTIAHIFARSLQGKPILRLSDSIITAVYYTGQARQNTSAAITVTNILPGVAHLAGPVQVTKKNSWLTLTVNATKIDSQVITTVIDPTSLPDIEQKYYDTVTVHADNALVTDLHFRVLVWIRPQPVLSIVVVTPDSGALPSNKPFRFIARALDQYSQPMSVPPALTWSATGGSVDPTGLFTPNISGGNAQIWVNVASNTAIADTASIRVTPCAQGLVYDFYNAVVISNVNQISALTPAKTGTATNISIAPATSADSFALRFTGYVMIPSTGIYTFYTSSDDGSALYIDKNKVVDNDGVHGTQERSGSVNLSPGLHEITVPFYEVAGGQELFVKWQGPGIVKAAIPDSMLFYATGSTNTRRSISETGITAGLTTTAIASRTGHGFSIQAPAKSPWKLEVVALDGKLLIKTEGNGNAIVPVPGSFKGFVIVRLKSCSGNLVLKMLIRL